MLAILFPHMYEELEYLLPVDDIVMHDVSEPPNTEVGQMIRAQAETTDAVAGPSRLPYNL